MKKLKKDPIREERIHNEAIVDAGPEERAMGWYYYLENQLRFPFQARCITAKSFRLSAKVKPSRSFAWRPKKLAAPTCSCRSAGKAGRMAVPLSQLAAIDVDQVTKEAIGDWHYWVSQGYLF